MQNKRILLGLLSVSSLFMFIGITPFYLYAQNTSNNKIDSYDEALEKLTQLAGENTKWAKYFDENQEYKECVGYNEIVNKCIDVVYESPNIIVIKSSFQDLLWKAVEEVMTDGYNATDLITYETTRNLNFEVLMSK